jgi:AraC-like DNA-binding protein
MSHVVRTPDPRLAPLLQRELLGFSRDEPEASTWLAAPRPIVTVMIDLEGELYSDGVRLPGAWIGGLGGAPTDVTVSGRYACLDLKLTPLGAYRLLAMPVSEISDDVQLSFGDAFGRAGEDLVDALHEAGSWDERLALAEGFLLERASTGPSPAPFVAWAWQRITDTRGRTTVGSLAGEIGCSRRHLQAKFSEQVGLSPKTAIRMTRFQHVCASLDAMPRRWADLAAEAGYADQAHLNRDFRELAGTTPSDYIVRATNASGLAADVD